MISGVTSTIKMGIIAAAVMGAVAAFWYVSGLRADLQQSQQNVQTLESSVNEQMAVITQMQEDQKQIAEIRTQLDDVVQRQQEEIDDLRDRFDQNAAGEDRDIGVLALKKPGLIQKIITNASLNAMRCVEVASGSELTEEERSESFVNQECPSIIANTSND